MLFLSFATHTVNKGPYTIQQRFSNYGPRTTNGPRGVPLWSSKKAEEKIKFK
jgi:hypothetical protein